MNHPQNPLDRTCIKRPSHGDSDDFATNYSQSLLSFRAFCTAHKATVLSLCWANIYLSSCSTVWLTAIVKVCHFLHRLLISTNEHNLQTPIPNRANTKTAALNTAMEGSVSAAMPTETSSRGSRGHHRHRRPRRARGDTTNESLSFRPASVAPDGNSEPPSAPTAHGPTNQSDAPTSARGGSRGKGRGGRVAPNRMVNGRQFGGKLTQEEPYVSALSHSPQQLQGDAPAFVPGQESLQRQAKAKQPKQRLRRPSKSQAPDIATRTHEDIDHGHYECPICTSEVRRNSKVWSCHTCWTVFHLTCIKKWSSNQGSTAAQNPNQDGQNDQPRQWRCPGCNLPKDETPKTYSCWCGKEVDPQSVVGLPPHSCGNTCGKERAKKCPHPCELTCHAGPCPPCAHMGPTQVCFCGKHEVTKRCSETNYDTGWSCGEICEELLPCGEHFCPRPCHEGLCGACEVRVPARCYCGQEEKDIVCSDREDEMESHCTHASTDSESIVESWTGSFNCQKICGRAFDCGQHHCEKQCHVQAASGEHCPRSPDVVTHCPCGKTGLAELTTGTRETCSDPIPHCHEVCGKMLPCGHLDEMTCHTGECAPCMKTVDIKCRCGRTSSRTLCHQGKDELPQCARTCRVLLNCGRHNCDERCCPGERKATERHSVKKKQRPLGSASRPVDDMFEAEHICTLQCDRLLKCGIHNCQELCHRGPCGSCREALFDEISCNCGRTVLQPPLPCGTKPPPCRYPCNRSKHCGHPQVAHNCHGDDEACPKCPFLISKSCMCGKKTLKNQQCWLQDVRCGEICGKKLRCGSHFCRKPCHRPGECEDASRQPCQQPCGKPKKTCGHPDMENTCHAPFECKEDKPCQSKIYITCSCQAQKQEMKCSASKNGEGNNGKILPCNDECARLERNRKLAMALNIDQTTHVEGGDHIPYSTDTLNLFAENIKFGQSQEREFRVFASSPEEKRLRFKPMQSPQRAFIHALAEDFGLDSESMDPEPHRHVMVWKTPRFISAPNKTLSEALRVRQAQRSATISANVSDSEGAKKTASHRASSEPFNAFLITNPRFGLTIDELIAEVASLLPPQSPLGFNIDFLPSEEVVMKATSPTLNPNDVQQMLQNMKLQLATVMSTKKYGTTELCATDHSLNILRRESDLKGGDGWSKVAAKRAAPRFIQPADGIRGNNTFSALGDGKVTFTKKVQKAKPRKESVVDDWEAAEIQFEKRDRVTSGDEGADVANERSMDHTATSSDLGERPPSRNNAEENAVSHSEPHNWAAEVEEQLQ